MQVPQQTLKYISRLRAHWIKVSNKMSYILPNGGLCKLQPGHIKDGRCFTLRRTIQQYVNRGYNYCLLLTTE